MAINKPELSDDSAIIRVIDFDMNLNPESLDQLPIQIFSDSDIAGIEVNAVETSESSGLFIATISLSQSPSASCEKPVRITSAVKIPELTSVSVNRYGSRECLLVEILIG